MSGWRFMASSAPLRPEAEAERSRSVRNCSTIACVRVASSYSSAFTDSGGLGKLFRHTSNPDGAARGWRQGTQ